MHNTHPLRLTFNQAAELYNTARPHYPEVLFDALEHVTGLKPGSKLLEIGPGTGQATEPFAKRGYKITAVELGADLAQVARRELQAYPNVEVITGAFEDISLPINTFDLVYAATAIKWVEPDIRFTKPHSLLKPDGHFAIIDTHHVSDLKGDAFFNASQVIYNKYYGSGETPILPKPEELQPTELGGALFKVVCFKLFPIVITYTAKGFANLLGTYSPMLALPEDKRTGFLGDMETFINNQFNGKVEKHFVMSLTVGRKQ